MPRFNKLYNDPNLALPVGVSGSSSYVVSSSLNDVISFWKLDEVSGTRLDVKSGNHLTDNNTVGQLSPGKLGNAAAFIAANSEWLSVASNSELQIGDIDFTIACQIMLDSKPVGLMEIAGKGGAAVYEWALEWTGSAFDRFRVNWGTLAFATANTFGAPSIGNWYFICFFHNTMANTINISVNNGTVDSFADGGLASVTTEPFTIGRIHNIVDKFFDGKVDAIGFWKRVLTASEITELYNGGIGKEYPF